MDSPNGPDDALERVGRLMVERGLARQFLHYSERASGHAVFTDEGKALRRLLQKAFDVPNKDPDALTAQEVVETTMFFLIGIEPVSPRNES